MLCGFLNWSEKMLLDLTNTLMNVQDKLEESFLWDEPMELVTTNTNVWTIASAFPAEADTFARAKLYTQQGDFFKLPNSNFIMSKKLFKSLCQQAIVKMHEHNASTNFFADSDQVGVWCKGVYNSARMLSFGAHLLIYNDKVWQVDPRLPTLLLMETENLVFFFTHTEFADFCKTLPS